MAEVMTVDARRAFLTEGTRTAVLATTRQDGRPHAAAIAFVCDDDDILFLPMPRRSRAVIFCAILG